MIDVKKTIFETLKYKINKLRFLGQNDSEGLKKVLFLIVLDDIYDWSNYLDDKQAVLKKLQDMRNHFILCNKDFIIKYTEMIPELESYINVNTPQTSSTWKRLWDNPDTIQIVDCLPRDTFYDDKEEVELAEFKTLNNYQSENNCI